MNMMSRPSGPRGMVRVVRHGERVCDLHGVIQYFFERQTLAIDNLLESLTRDQFHGDEIDPLEAGDIVNVNYIGMIERGHGASLLRETAPPLRVGYLSFR